MVTPIGVDRYAVGASKLALVGARLRLSALTATRYSASKLALVGGMVTPIGVDRYAVSASKLALVGHDYAYRR